MNVEQMVEQYLRDNGFDGLAPGNGEPCGCRIGDLAPCGIVSNLLHCVSANVRDEMCYLDEEKET